MEDPNQYPNQAPQQPPVPPPNPPPPVPAPNQQASVQYQYGYQVHQHIQPEKPGNGLGVAGLVLGILACCFAFIPVFGAPMAILLILIGIPMSAVALNKSSKAGGSGKGIAVAGLVLQIAAIVIMILWGLIIAVGVSEVTEEASKQTSPQSQEEETSQQNSARSQRSEPAIKTLDYEISTEEDVSYAGCSRIAYRINFEEGATEQEVKEFVEGKLIDELRGDHQDITIWGYRWGEPTNQVNTLGTFTKSDCE